MAGIAVRRTVGSVALATIVTMLLAACLPFPTLGESSNGMSPSIDTEAVATAVTATSSNIESTVVETSIDGLTTRLWVAPVLPVGTLTATELDAVLRAAYTSTRGKVSTIEVHAIDPAEASVDISEAAAELGITHLTNQNSVTYSTEYLETAYAE